MIIGIAEFAYRQAKKQYDEKNGVEKFNDEGLAVLWIMWAVFVNIILPTIALFICFRRNPQINGGAIIAAFCCPICYITYALAVPIAK